MEWIDTLRELADEWPGWRSEAEKTHVYGQFDEARAVYEGFAREARQGAAGLQPEATQRKRDR
jgi:hypothetical protein